jgi:hypothetical protein
MAHDSAADITPETKIGSLLERWPALEELLVSLSPHFRALKNPVLRRTVAKVATVRQAASVAGLPLGEVVDRLREGAGLPPLALAGAAEETARPAWASAAAVVRTHDARAAIANERQPLPEVMADLAALRPGEVYALVTPFVPAPLVELAREKGFEAYSVREGPDAVRTWFRRAAPAGDAR